ncbi:MAG: hypothetical protein JWP97_1785, partial [Labilithrix sp.]|nr:hypothetical protein [Labilithrix sp.]
MLARVKVTPPVACASGALLLLALIGACSDQTLDAGPPASASSSAGGPEDDSGAGDAAASDAAS